MLINEKLALKPDPAKDGTFNFPIFHHSIIPCTSQKLRLRKTPLFLVRDTNPGTLTWSYSHFSGAFGSVTKNVLPSPGSDSSRIEPPSLSVHFFTTASPIPVP